MCSAEELVPRSACEVTQSCPTLWDPMDYSLPGSSLHGILQARVLEWVAFSSPGDLPDPRIKPVSPALREDSLPLSPQGRLLEYKNQSQTRKTCI